MSYKCLSPILVVWDSFFNRKSTLIINSSIFSIRKLCRQIKLLIWVHGVLNCSLRMWNTDLRWALFTLSLWRNLVHWRSCGATGLQSRRGKRPDLRVKLGARDRFGAGMLQQPKGIVAIGNQLYGRTVSWLHLRTSVIMRLMTVQPSALSGTPFQWPVVTGPNSSAPSLTHTLMISPLWEPASPLLTLLWRNRPPVTTSQTPRPPSQTWSSRPFQRWNATTAQRFGAINRMRSRCVKLQSWLRWSGHAARHGRHALCSYTDAQSVDCICERAWSWDWWQCSHQPCPEHLSSGLWSPDLTRLRHPSLTTRRSRPCGSQHRP